MHAIITRAVAVLVAAGACGCGRDAPDKREAPNRASAKADAARAPTPAPLATSAMALPPRSWARPERAGECDRLLRDLCGERMCATFEDARAALVLRKTATCLAGDLGTCDAGHFVDYASTVDALSATYDAKGALIALEARGGATTDCSIGPKRACTPKPNDRFCAPRPISEHCTGPCPSLADTLAKLATEGGCPPGANIDKLACGGHVIVDERHGDASITRYFDAKGKLVAAQAMNPEVRVSMRWGDTPQCSTSTSEALCPPPPTAKAPKKRKP